MSIKYTILMHILRLLHLKKPSISIGNRLKNTHKCEKMFCVDRVTKALFFLLPFHLD